MLHKFNLMFLTSLVAMLVALPGVMSQTVGQDNLVIITTPKGDISLMLYDDTPLHRENFLKLARQGFFDSTLFHRVINDFMIQGGDPDSRHATPGIELGNGGPGYDIPAEIMPNHFHRRGVLAAAREDDKINPKRLSSGSQFYIVQGKTFSQPDLDMIEKEQNSLTKQRIFVNIMDRPENQKLRNQFFSPDAKKDSVHFRYLLDTLNKMIDKEYVLMPEFKLSDEQRQAYSTIGGVPHLDGKYTIFGEVVSGMEIVDAIAREKTDENDRPLTDIPMKVKIITRKKTNP